MATRISILEMPHAAIVAALAIPPFARSAFGPGRNVRRFHLYAGCGPIPLRVRLLGYVLPVRRFGRRMYGVLRFQHWAKEKGPFRARRPRCLRIPTGLSRVFWRLSDPNEPLSCP